MSGPIGNRGNYGSYPTQSRRESGTYAARSRSTGYPQSKTHRVGPSTLKTYTQGGMTITGPVGEQPYIPTMYSSRDTSQNPHPSLPKMRTPPRGSGLSLERNKEKEAEEKAKQKAYDAVMSTGLFTPREPGQPFIDPKLRKRLNNGPKPY